MNDLKNSIYTIAVIAVSVGVLDVFSFSQTFRKYTRFALSLVITLMLLFPLTSMINSVSDGFGDVNFEDEDSIQNTTNYLTESFKASVLKNLSDTFSVPQDAFTVEMEVTDTPTEILIDSLRIKIVKKKYYRYAERIESYLKSNFGCDVEVLQMAGE